MLHIIKLSLVGALLAASLLNGAPAAQADGPSVLQMIEDAIEAVVEPERRDPDLPPRVVGRSKARSRAMLEILTMVLSAAAILSAALGVSGFFALRNETIR